MNYQVVYGKKSHHHNTFTELCFNPNLFEKLKDAQSFIGKEKKTNPYISYFIFKVY